ncbi:amino acid/amide ABC transporter membrane protein 2, HAAT family [Rhizobiales bacterium GAS113]|nr:amino acid/amide ABC transporter membrane protein 2, HAAT family [Rhizobiales bacterium GAS113]
MKTAATPALLLAIALIALVALLALPFAAPAIGMASLTPLATRILIYGIAAASLNLILGYGGLVSFGHAAYFGVGGYVVGILYQHFAEGSALFGFIAGSNELLVTVPAAMLVCALLAAAIGALSLRTSGVQFIMITLAFAQMIYFLFVSLKAYGGDDGLIIRRRDVLAGLDIRDDRSFYFLCLTIAAIVHLVIHRLVNSRFGLVLTGISQNERRMAAMGVASFRYKLTAFVIAGAFAGLAGALIANQLRFVSPDLLHWTKSGELMIMVILGGVGTLFGPLIGAAALILLETVLQGWTENWQLGLGLVLLFVVLFTKGGLSALLSRLKPRPA